MLDDLSGDAIRALLELHVRWAHDNSPPGSVHALDLEGLRASDISFWTAWADDALLGCIALKQLGDGAGEIKSMRTAPAHLRKGVAAALLEHVVREAQARGYQALNLETGAVAAFAPARALYRRFGFVECVPFGDYLQDGFSVCMTLDLPRGQA